MVPEPCFFIGDVVIFDIRDEFPEYTGTNPVSQVVIDSAIYDEESSEWRYIACNRVFREIQLLDNSKTPYCLTSSFEADDGYIDDRELSFGEILVTEFMIPMGITLTELSRKTGIYQDHLEDMIFRGLIPTEVECERLAKVLGNSKEFWINLR